MQNNNVPLTIGIDLVDKFHEICILNGAGEVISEDRIENEVSTLNEYLDNFRYPKNVLVALEAGTHSPWISELLTMRSFKVLVGNPRKLQMIWQSDFKTDKRDALMLARIARFDKNLLSPIKHRSKKSQCHLAIIKSRNNLVQCRTKLINSVKGMLKSQGIKITAAHTSLTFGRRVMDFVPKEMYSSLAAIIQTINFLTRKITEFDRNIEELCTALYPEAEVLKQIRGVGSLTALTFILTLEDPDRFKKSRDVGPFLGLVPRKDQSGSQDKQLSITKAGNVYLRQSMVAAAHYILGPFGTDCDLRRYGEKIADKAGGKTGKKKAVVAVARKLSVLMHRLWKTQEEYKPFRKSA